MTEEVNLPELSAKRGGPTPMSGRHSTGRYDEEREADAFTAAMNSPSVRRLKPTGAPWEIVRPSPPALDSIPTICGLRVAPIPDRVLKIRSSVVDAKLQEMVDREVEHMTRDRRWYRGV